MAEEKRHLHSSLELWFSQNRNRTCIICSCVMPSSDFVVVVVLSVWKEICYIAWGAYTWYKLCPSHQCPSKRGFTCMHSIAACCKAPLHLLGENSRIWLFGMKHETPSIKKALFFITICDNIAAGINISVWQRSCHFCSIWSNWGVLICTVKWTAT